MPKPEYIKQLPCLRPDTQQHLYCINPILKETGLSILEQTLCHICWRSCGMDISGKKKCTHSRLWCSYSKIILQRQPTWTIQIHHPTLFLSETASSFAVIVDYINDKECESNSNISITYLPHQALGRLQWIITEWFINEVERGIRRKDAKHTHTN